MSKKVAEGTRALVMDIKVGRAALCKTVESATALARSIVSAASSCPCRPAIPLAPHRGCDGFLAHAQVDVATLLDVPTRAVLTRMDVPIGRAVGNALEVHEAIQCLRAAGPRDLEELVCVLGERDGDDDGLDGSLPSLPRRDLTSQGVPPIP